MMYGFHGPAIMGVGMMLYMLFWVVVIGAGIFLLVRFLNRTSHSTHAQTRPDPLSILKERYARGEIDDETFQRMKENLKD